MTVATNTKPTRMHSRPLIALCKTIIWRILRGVLTNPSYNTTCISCLSTTTSISFTEKYGWCSKILWWKNMLGVTQDNLITWKLWNTPIFWNATLMMRSKFWEETSMEPVRRPGITNPNVKYANELGRVWFVCYVNILFQNKPFVITKWSFFYLNHIYDKLNKKYQCQV